MLFFITNLFAINLAISQRTAINSTGNSPDPSATLDVSGTTSGVLINRLTESEKFLIQSPATGLLIYQTDGTSPGFWYFNGTSWMQSLGVPGAASTMPAGNNSGDMNYWNGNDWEIIPAGQPGQILQISPSSLPTWSTP